MGNLLLIVSLLAVPMAAGAAAPAKHRPEERMDVADVLSAGDGQFVVVLKTHGKPGRYLPIWVGETDAVALKLRLTRRDPQRPMTLNLLEQVLRATNVKVTEVAIDDIRDGAFLGKIRLKQNNRTWDMEARPSDAIALAMGRHVPILVTRDILEGAGIEADSLGELFKPRPGEGRGAKGAPESSGTDASAYDETL